MLQIRERSIYKTAIKWPMDFKESLNYRVIERYPDGQPQLIRFDCVQGVYVSFSKNWKSLKTASINVFYKNGLPYAVAPEIDPVTQRFPLAYYDSRDAIRGESANEDFTMEHKKLIAQYFTGEKTKDVDNSASYAAVLKKLDAYPKEWDMKNCIGIVYNLRDHYVLTSRPITGINHDGDEVVLNTSLDYIYDGQVNEEHYRNISNHPIIVKGIMKKKTRDGYVYSDESLKVGPGEVFNYFTIFKNYDPLKETDFNIVEYFGDAGTISNAMMAKTIKPGVLEIDSYVNSTSIYLNKGDKISIKASGKIMVGVLAGQANPDGISGFDRYSKEPDFAHGQLIGRIGKSGWFKVGRSATITAADQGMLELTVNDGDPANNVGTFTIEYIITKVPR